MTKKCYLAYSFILPVISFLGLVLFHQSCKVLSSRKVEAIKVFYKTNDSIKCIREEMFDKNNKLTETHYFINTDDTIKKVILTTPNIKIISEYKNSELINEEIYGKYNNGVKTFDIILKNGKIRSYSLYFYDNENQFIKSIEEAYTRNLICLYSEKIERDSLGYLNSVSTHRSSKINRSKEKYNNGLIQEVIIIKDSLNSHVFYNYNSNNQLVEKKTFKGDSLIQLDIYEYNKNNQKVNEEHYFNNRLVLGKEFIYEDTSYVKSYNYTNKKRWKAYELFVDGNVKIDRDFDENGDITINSLFEFNKNGKIIKEVYEEERRNYYKKNKYNSIGNIKEEIYYKTIEFDTIDYKISYKYKYY